MSKLEHSLPLATAGIAAIANIETHAQLMDAIAEGTSLIAKRLADKAAAIAARKQREEERRRKNKARRMFRGAVATLIGPLLVRYGCAAAAANRQTVAAAGWADKDLITLADKLFDDRLPATSAETTGSKMYFPLQRLLTDAEAALNSQTIDEEQCRILRAAIRAAHRLLCPKAPRINEEPTDVTSSNDDQGQGNQGQGGQSNEEVESIDETTSDDNGEESPTSALELIRGPARGSRNLTRLSGTIRSAGECLKKKSGRPATPHQECAASLILPFRKYFSDLDEVLSSLGLNLARYAELLYKHEHLPKDEVKLLKWITQCPVVPQPEMLALLANRIDWPLPPITPNETIA